MIILASLIGCFSTTTATTEISPSAQQVSVPGSETLDALSAWPLTTWQVYEFDVHLGALTISPGAYNYVAEGEELPSTYMRTRFPFFDHPVGAIELTVAEGARASAAEGRGTLFTCRFEGSEEVFLVRHEERTRLYFHASFSEYQIWTIETAPRK